MRIGTSIFLIAVGAILRFAMRTTLEGIDLGVTGVILMLVGGVGLILSLLFWSGFSPSRRRAPIDGSSVVHEVQTTSTREPEIV